MPATVAVLSEPKQPLVFAPIAELVVLTQDGEPSVRQAPVNKAEAVCAIAPDATPAETLFATVRGLIQVLLKTVMKDVEVANALNVPPAQAKAWLKRLVEDGAIEKQKKPAGYIVKQSSLFE
jgi:hypothetical protein